MSTEPQGSVTVQAISAIETLLGETPTYDAYQIFSGDVTSDGRLSGLGLASPITAANLYAFLHGNSNGASAAYSGANDDLGGMAVYIADNINASSNAGMADIGGHKVVSSSSFAYKFAEWVKAQYATAGADPQVEEVETDAQLTGDQGYYLLVASSDSPLGTAPIWYPLGATGAITYKADVPTFSMSVFENSANSGAGAYQDYADAAHGQLVNYKMSVTLPSNYKSYPSYKVVATASLHQADFAQPVLTNDFTVNGAPASTAASITPVAAHDEVPAVYNVSFTIDDVMTSYPSLTNNGTLEFVYQAALNSTTGTTGNPTTGELQYSADPLNASNLQTMTDEVNTFTHGLNVSLTDAATHTAIPGAKFNLKNSDGLWVVDNAGTLSSAKPASAVFTTSTEAPAGTFSVTGLDAGTYTLVEEEAAESYAGLVADGLTFDIVSGFNAGGLNSLALGNTFTHGESAAIGGASMIGEPAGSGDVANGIVTLNVMNERQIALPLTGTTAPFLIAMSLAALAAMCWLALRRAKRNVLELERDGD